MERAAYDERELRSRAIEMSQLCGIKEYTLDNGPGAGVRMAEVYTGSGLTFAVAKDRGFDLAETYYKGMALHFRTFGGMTSPSESYARGSEFLRSFYGGLMMTCGTTYTGRPCVDQGEELGLHGRHSNQKARVRRVDERWLDGRYVLELEGEVREAALFGPNVSLRRTIRSSYLSDTIEIADVFTNHHNVAVPHGMLYHFTFGYPLVVQDRDGRLLGGAHAPDRPVETT